MNFIEREKDNTLVTSIRAGKVDFAFETHASIIVIALGTRAL